MSNQKQDNALHATGFRGNPTRIVMSNGEECLIADKLVDEMAGLKDLGTVFEHRVEIYTGQKKSYEEDKYRVTEHRVLAENDTRLVLGDITYTRLDKAKDRHFNSNDVLGIPSVSVHVNNSIWSDGVILRLFDVQPWSSTRLQNAINRAIEEKCGWMKGKISLAILKGKPSHD